MLKKFIHTSVTNSTARGAYPSIHYSVAQEKFDGLLYVCTYPAAARPVWATTMHTDGHSTLILL